MSEVLQESLGYLFLSIIAAGAFAPMMIYLMYRTNQVVEHKKSKLGGGMEDTNDLFLKIIDAKFQNGTPNMGGIMVWLIVPLMTLLLVDRTFNINIFLSAFLLFGFWGFLDVLLNNKMKKDPNFRTMQEKFGVRLFRFSIAVLLNMVITYILYRDGAVANIDLGFTQIGFGLWLVPVLAVVAQFAIYSAEITDGLDGLMIGIFGIIYSALGILLFAQQNYEFLPVIGIIIGVIIIDLYFNIPPARFFNGGPGAMPLGLGAFIIALVSDNLIAYFIISLLTWLIMSSSMIQILSMKFLKKRVFKIAPIHHHFQAVGWPAHKVTMRFWLSTVILAFLGVYVGLLIG